MDPQQSIDAVERVPVNRFHLSIMLCCSLLMMFDGYDLVIYGAVLPSLMADWNLSPAVAGAIGSSALAGMFLGAITLGSLADRFGRRKIIFTCLAIFGAAAFVNAFSRTPTEFIACRFVTGVGLGGMVPNIVALMSEMSPRRRRNVMVTVMLSFFAVGGVLAAVLGRAITPEFGWRMNFIVAGLPLLALPFLYRFLPESLSYLLVQRRMKEADAVLRKLAPGFAGTAADLVDDRPPSGSERSKGEGGFALLFKGGKARDTLLLWLAFSMSALMLYELNTWLPKFMLTAGYSLGSSLSFLITLNVGAIAGACLSGVLADKWGGRATLLLWFALSAVSITLLGYRQSDAVLTVLLLVVGATALGTFGIIHAYAAQLYPAHIRATGVGWAA
jgi:AAHS family benzoate transporter-like MFS transporter